MQPMKFSGYSYAAHNPSWRRLGCNVKGVCWLRISSAYLSYAYVISSAWVTSQANKNAFSRSQKKEKSEWNWQKKNVQWKCVYEVDYYSNNFSRLICNSIIWMDIKERRNKKRILENLFDMTKRIFQSTMHMNL